VCLFAFQWLAPEFVGETRGEIESDLKGLYDSVVDIGKGVEFDIFGNYRETTWLNTQKEKHESGYYRDDNGLKYYNAVQDKMYYQRPDGRWQDMDSYDPPIDNPFETPQWQPVSSIDEITGLWTGATIVSFPARENRNPAFTSKFTMTLNRNHDLVDIGFKLDLENYLEALIAAYPSFNATKESVWAGFLEKNETPQSVNTYGKYYMNLYQEDIPLENILEKCPLQINNDSTRIRAIIPSTTFGFAGMDDMECILSKETQ
jgi:hypothetical protein